MSQLAVVVANSNSQPAVIYPLFFLGSNTLKIALPHGSAVTGDSEPQEKWSRKGQLWPLLKVIFFEREGWKKKKPSPNEVGRAIFDHFLTRRLLP